MSRNPSRANKCPTDLGVLGLAATKEALDRKYGPPNTQGKIVPDDFSNLTHEQKLEASKRGRQLSNDHAAVFRATLGNLIKIYFANKMLRAVGEQVLGTEAAKRVSWLIILAVLYKRWGAKPALSKVRYKGMTVPFLGALPEMAYYKRELHDHLLRVARAVNFETVEIPVPLVTFIVLMDARDREYVLKTNPWNYLKNRENDPSSFEHIFSEILGRGIFATDKSEWLEARKIASHMFSGHALRTKMERVFNHHADRVIDLLVKSAVGKNKVIDMQEIYQCAVFDAFCEIAFGVFPNATDSAIEGSKPQFLISFDFAQTHSSERVATPPVAWHLARLFSHYTGLGKEAELTKHMEVISKYIGEIIDKRLQEDDISQHNDLLSLYIQFSRNQKQQFSREDFMDIIANFMVAGRDTTSCTLTYVTKFLGENPHVLQRLEDEGLFELGRESATGEVSWDDTKQIPYADAVVNEVLRMAPPVGDDFRICVHEDILPSGLKVREGTRVGFTNLAVGRDPFLWSDPDTFEPERWMKYDSEGIALPVRRVDEYVHPIFFAGRRLCLGKDMARFEAIVFMSKLFRKLKITPIPNQDQRMVMGPVIFFKQGLKCTVELR